MNDLEKLIRTLDRIKNKYEGYPWLQRHELIELGEEFHKIRATIKELQEEVAGEVDQKETHCGRCGNDFHELNEEANDLEGYCCYCAQVGREPGDK